MQHESTNRTSSVVVTEKAYAYDANGNLTNDTRFAYEWDCENRLAAVRDASTGALVQSNRYDALWRRREKIEYAPDGTATTNRYLYKDWLVLAITDGEGNVLETYTHGADLSGEVGSSAGGIGGILASTQAGSAAFYAYDFNGNIVGVTDASGVVVSTLTYTPFGEVLARTGPFTPRYQFSTKEYSPRTGLNYYGYRFYNPTLGRWMTRDPFGEINSVTLYEVENNNPISYLDYLGLTNCEIGKIRNPKPGFTIVRLLGNPNADNAAEDIIASLEKAGKIDNISTVLKILASLSLNASATPEEFAQFIMNQAGLGPKTAAKIGQQLFNFYKKRGKETQGVTLWTRVCYEECVSSKLPFMGNCWQTRCEKWSQYFRGNKDNRFDFFESEQDAMNHSFHACEMALKNFAQKHSMPNQTLGE